MRAFAILLILLGPLIAGGSWIYSVRESDRRLTIWVQQETAALHLAQITADAQRHAEMERQLATRDFAGLMAGASAAVTALQKKTEIVAKLRKENPQLDAILKGEAPEAERALLRRMAPAWTVVDPWPGILAGIGCSAFGILLLAIVGGRPRREEEPPDPFEIAEFKWRKD